MLALNLCEIDYKKSERVEISAALEHLRVSHHSTFAGKGVKGSHLMAKNGDGEYVFTFHYDWLPAFN